MSAISLASRNPDKMSVTMVRSYHQQDEDETEVEADSITKGNLFNKTTLLLGHVLVPKTHCTSVCLLQFMAYQKITCVYKNWVNTP